MTGLYGTKGINKRHFLVNTLFLSAYIYCDIGLDDLLQKYKWISHLNVLTDHDCYNIVISMKHRNIKTIPLYGQTSKEVWAKKSFCHVEYFYRLTLYRRIKIVKLSFWYRKRYNLIEKNGTRDKCNREDSFVYLAFLDIRSSWFMPWDLPLQLPFKTHKGSIYAHILYVWYKKLVYIYIFA